jgi:hypothetical protein
MGLSIFTEGYLPASERSRPERVRCVTGPKKSLAPPPTCRERAVKGGGRADARTLERENQMKMTLKFCFLGLLAIAATPLVSAEAATARYACSVNVFNPAGELIASQVDFAAHMYGWGGAMFVTEWKSGRREVTTVEGNGWMTGDPGQEVGHFLVTKTVTGRKGDKLSEVVLASVTLEGTDRRVVETNGFKTVVICAVGKD